ncbi:MAG: hypothetical protein Hyperionvirus7_34 [Hyperionvirus sp.]|uniref:Uncharacterized protein n=1 Tax=Hyperionvirus sp. TaxID=2487770 RepID=A0A3G5AC72_9VIRU|nr:MAG: hypothetical protein Hyperionvirus7_34 [Hyperionvirus sp.]
MLHVRHLESSLFCFDFPQMQRSGVGFGGTLVDSVPMMVCGFIKEGGCERDKVFNFFIR